MDRPITSPFEGELVRLRAREQADLSTLNAMFVEPEVLAGLQMTFPQSSEGIRAYHDANRSNEADLGLAIETLEGRELIGLCSIENAEGRARSASFGIWIGKRFWNRGYGTDATRTICGFGFRQMNLHRISLCVYAATNPKAVRTYEKAGFRIEGVERGNVFVGGAHHDVTLMAAFADEFDLAAS